MKRRSFLKMLTVALATPTAIAQAVMNNPVAYTAEASIAANKLWAKAFFDCALEDMVMTKFMGGAGSIIQIQKEVLKP